MNSVLIKNGTVIDPDSALNEPQDILIENELISAVDKPGAFNAIEQARKAQVNIIDAKGMIVVPGLIDVHVHLREPGFEWKETVATGAEGAVRGGFTSICCMPNTRPSNDSAEISKFIKERAEAAGKARVFPIGAVSLGLQGKEMAPLNEMHSAGCVAFSDDGEPIYNSAMMRRALEWCRMLGVPICCHEEDKNLSSGGCMHESALSLRLGLRGMPAVAEEVMIARDIELARVTKGHVHFCHVSTARGVELIKRAKEDGILVSAEVTPHHLTLSEERICMHSKTTDSIRPFDTNAKMSPPLRSEEDIEALLNGLNSGIIDMIASDHAPHDVDSKLCEFDKAAFGILGFPTTLSLVIQLIEKGSMSIERAIESLTSMPAKLFGLKGLGTLKKGSYADILVCNPSYEWELSKDNAFSLSSNSPFWGQKLRGRAHSVLVGGKVVL